VSDNKYLNDMMDRGATVIDASGVRTTPLPISKKFTVDFDFMFSVQTDDPENLQPSEIREALIKRAESLADNDVLEACGEVERIDNATGEYL